MVKKKKEEFIPDFMKSSSTVKLETPEKESYSALLKKPQWQKRRLEIYQRDEWKCQCCNDTETELHVHHKVYRDGLNPWQYEDNELITLCANCHGIYHAISKEYKFKGEIKFSVFVAYDDVDCVSYFVFYGSSLYFVTKTILVNSVDYEVIPCLDMPLFNSFSNFLTVNDTWH